MVALTGPLATASREPRQARKGATVVADSCAAVWLARAASTYIFTRADIPVTGIHTCQDIDEET